MAASWWINRADRSTTTKRVVYGANPSVAPYYLPDCDGKTGGETKTTTKLIAFNALNHPQGWDRLPKLAVTQTNPNRTISAFASVTDCGSDPECAASQYNEYDAYGNSTTSTSHAGGPAPALAPNVTAVTYTADGYFPDTVNNALNQTISTVMEPAFGSTVSSTVVGNAASSIKLANITDAFGRAVKVSGADLTDPTLTLAPPTHTALAWCDASCPSLAVFKATISQEGSPPATNYMDVLGRPIRGETVGFAGEPIFADTTYHRRGWVTKQTLPFTTGETPFGTSFEDHDALGRPTTKRIEWPGHWQNEGFNATYVYQGHQRTVSLPANLHTDPTTSLTVSHVTNALGQVMKTTDAKAQSTTFLYDANGGRTYIKDPGGHSVTTDYDNFGRPILVSDPDGGDNATEYDGFGQVRRSIDARGYTIETRYDILGRPTQRYVAPPGVGTGVLDADWSYDAQWDGALDAERRYGTDGLTVEFERMVTYDNLGRTKSVKSCLDGTCTTGLVFEEEVAYDGHYGRVKATKAPSGEIVESEYNAYGFPVAQRDPMPTADPSVPMVYRRLLAMSPRGQLLEESYGNGLVGSYAYQEGTGQLLKACVGTPGANGKCDEAVAAYLSTFEYNDHYANLTKRSTKRFASNDMATDANIETFQYDDLHRLTGWNRSWTRGGNINADPPPAAGDPNVTYQYSACGNLLNKSDWKNGDTYEYGSWSRGVRNAGPHAVLQLNDGTGRLSSTHGYDLSGNMVTSNGKTLTYDAFNLVTEIEDLTGGPTTHRYFAYDPGGQRYKQELWKDGVLTRTTYYVGKGFERVIEGPVQDVTTDRTYVGGYLMIASDPGGGNRALRYLHRDQLGSTVTITDELGLPLDNEIRGFDPWGKPLSPDWGINASGLDRSVNERGFTDHEHLDEEEIIHMNGRLFDYNLARFMGVDPIIQFPNNTQSVNAYSYIMNNPFAGTDPTGYSADSTASPDATAEGTGGGAKLDGDCIDNCSFPDDVTTVEKKKSKEKSKEKSEEKPVSDLGGGQMPEQNWEPMSALSLGSSTQGGGGGKPRGGGGLGDSLNQRRDNKVAMGSDSLGQEALQACGGFHCTDAAADQSLQLHSDIVTDDKKVAYVALGLVVGFGVVPIAYGVGTTLAAQFAASNAAMLASLANYLNGIAPRVADFSRALRAADLGLRYGTQLEKLKGTISLAGRTLRVRVDMIQAVEGAKIHTFRAIQNVVEAARGVGANVVRFEGSFANPTLMNLLSKRYNIVSQGANEFFEIMIK